MSLNEHATMTSKMSNFMEVEREAKKGPAAAVAEAEEVKEEEIDEDAEAAEVMATVLQEDDEEVFMKPAIGFLLSQKWGFFTYKEWITKQQFLYRCQLNGLEVATDKDG